MRKFHALAAALVATVSLSAQQATPPAQAGDADRKVAGGGIMAPGWAGNIDTSAAKAGGKIEDSKFVLEGGKIAITTGPAGNYWNPANVAKGDYTVKATFHEPSYMNLNDHPHPYGLFIGGNDLGTPEASLLYCAPYGNGTFIVRGFGPAAFQMNGRGGAHEAIKKVEKGQPVTQDVMWSVRGGRAECSINGVVVAGYNTAELVGAGKLKSLDGVYGIRAAHNVDLVVTGLEKK
jgi:hypothetical protein